jgi:putative phage-type endonuclease
MSIAGIALQSPAEDRTRFLGGSDIAAILGISPWSTAYDVWLEKTGQPKDFSDPMRERRFRRGQRMEPLIIEMLQEEHDLWVTDRNTRWYHPEHPFLAAQIDFEYRVNPEFGLPALDDRFDIGNGEVKSVDPRAAFEWGPDGSQEIPAHYAAQVMFGLAVTGRAEATVAALIGDDLRVYRFERDEELCAALVKMAVGFWTENVGKLIPPPPQSKQDAAAMVKRFAGLSIEAGEELQALLGVWQSLRTQRLQIEKDERSAEQSVLDAILIAAEAHGVPQDDPDKVFVLSGGRQLASWNLQRRKGYVVKDCEFRVLRLKGEKHARD